MLERIEAGIFLWNVFPLHPHDMGSPFTNRQHNVRERRAGEEVLGRLIQLLKPRRIVAIGNDAAMAVARLESLVPIVSVRHPSYGGQRQFMDQISEMYSIIPTQQVGLF
jgi:uracil-DNA glycosylase